MKWWQIVLLVLLIGVVYGKSFSYGWNYFDGNLLVLERQAFLQDSANAVRAFQENVFFEEDMEPLYYRPVLTLSLMADAMVGETDAFEYRLTNLMLHGVAVLLVWWFLQRIVDEMLSWWLALVMAVHPAIMHAVAWVPGRNDLLFMVFAMGFLLALDSWLREEKGWQLVLAGCFWLVALFTKESGLVLPVLGAAWVWARSDGVDLRNTLLLTNGKWGKWIVGWMVGGVGVWFWLREAAFAGRVETSLVDRVWPAIENLPGVLVYIQKLVVPVGLSVTPVFQDSLWWLGGVMFMVIGFMLWRYGRRDWRMVVFGLVWFFGLLLPSFIPGDLSQQTHLLLEHRMYESMLGVLLIFGVLIERWWRKYHKEAYWLWMIPLLLGLLTFVRLPVYQNAQAFWESAVADSPHAAMAYSNLGVIYQNQRRFDAAVTAFERAIELHESQYYAHGNLGAVLLDQGKYEQALQALQKELEYRDYDDLRFNLGVAYMELGEPEKAREQWELALERNSEHVLSHVTLTQYYFYVAENMEQARVHYSKAKELGASFVEEIEEGLGVEVRGVSGER